MNYDSNWKQKQIDRYISTSEVRLAKIYRSTARNIKSELSNLYEKYSISGSLTYAEMSKYNRLNNLFVLINAEINDSFKTIVGETKNLVSTVFEESYYMNGFILSKDVGLNLNFGVIPTEAIKSLINKPNVSGLSLLETLGKSRYNLLLRERQTMIQGFIQGDSYPDMAKRISGIFDKSFNEALRIVKTEGGRASSEGQLASFDDAEEMGIEFERMWVHVLGGQKNPRQSHIDADGQIANKDGMFHVDGYLVPAPRMFGVAEHDINCLCDVIANVGGEKPKVRRSNIGDKEIIEYKTYREWEADQKKK